MPAVVRCPNGCKLRVPIRKLFDTIQCPKCDVALLVAKEQIEKFQADQTHVLTGNHSSDLVELVSDSIVFLEGESNNLLGEVTRESVTSPKPPGQGPANQPPPIPFETHQQTIPTGPVPPLVQPTSTDTVFPGESQLPGDANWPSDGTGNPLTALKRVDETLRDEESEIDKLEQKLSAAKARRESITGRGIKFFTRWLSDEENPGTIQNTENCWKAYSLSWAMVIIGIFLLGPVIYTMLEWIGEDYHLPLGRWSLLLIFFSAIQFLYAVYLFQIPDWTTTRLVSYLMLAMTVFSTCLLAIALLSQESNSFFKYLQLSIVDKGKVSGWLTVMSIGFGLMSYLCGRTTQLWMREESRRQLPV